MEFKRPNKDSVDLGDYLVNNRRLFPITKIRDLGILCRGNFEGVSTRYEMVIILKRDGTYLVGEKVFTGTGRI